MQVARPAAATGAAPTTRSVARCSLRRCVMLQPRRVAVAAAAPSWEQEPEGQQPPSTHPEARDVDEETHDFNMSNLGVLQQRIAEIRQAQALHMLRHRFTPSTLHDVVEEGLTSRPDTDEGHAKLTAWHEAQWQRMRAAIDDNL